MIARSRWFECFLATPRAVTAETTSERGDYFLRTIRADLDETRRWEAIDRLSRRALAAESVSYPGIIPVLDAELDRPPFYIVEPFVAGRSLNVLTSGSQATSVSRLLWIARQVAEILSVSHDQDRVHLGVSPEHVIVGDDGKVNVGGWSQSHKAGQRTWLPIETSEDVFHLAPETITANYRAENSADVYSMGILIYWLFAGCCPFAADDAVTVAAGHRNRIAPDLQSIQSLCPGPINQLVAQMLAKNPLRRPAMKSLVDQLISIEIDHLHDQRIVKWNDLPSWVPSTPTPA